MAAAVQIHDVIDKNEHFRLQSTPCANVWIGAKGSNRITLTMEDDRRVHVRHISETEDESLREKAIRRLHRMVSHCKNRKKLIDQYLGDELSDPCLNNCDNCRKPKNGGHINSKDYAMHILKCAQSALNIVPKPNHANFMKTFTRSLSKEIKQLKLNE